ncbi:MAG: protein from nitrogen regulatory protein P-II (GLNB) family, ortholog YAAQ B. subtilis [uncultured Chloroflexia bacterium]|uniref:Protein from nitrogen regulatory protein P-II (GLNB) family, ortholog YAAQ B. subtilis n=1 Tax=uncultured Chloroflexia bacterium TaxID=1672391 RepID=A0A6J4MB66_9CHLR|nr:MAG: protein from nitrogen regulatory protein P-II (GLNB) family, ortholog YAAQ B. subtilis [uncultured Chloroflexia bacterium]
MKLAVFIVDNSRIDATVDALVAQGFRVTRLATTGGFLRRGNTTLLVGIEENDLERATSVVHAKAPGTVFLTLDLERYERL